MFERGEIPRICESGKWYILIFIVYIVNFANVGNI